MKVLIACERSGTIRDTFIEQGHTAVSCDLQDTIKPGPHYKGDVFDIINDGWDLMIAHPPCTYLTVTGNKWFKPEFKDRFPTREQDRIEAIDFFMKLANAPITKIAIENPIGIMSSRWRKPDQVIQPFYFGDEARKATCLWLKGLPLLFHAKETDLFAEKTHVGQGEIITYKSGKTCAKWYADAVKLSPQERMNVRSQTFKGIADAMGEQWG